MRAIAIALVTLPLVAACGDSGHGADDVDASASIDAAPGGLDAGADASMPGVDCGKLKASVDAIKGTEGLAIGPDGTIYFSQKKAIGRLQPGQPAVADWVKLTGAGGDTVWGLALTAQHLYAGYPGGTSIWRIDLATGKGEAWLPDAGQPNGVIIGADGALYYSDYGSDTIYRVDLATKRKTQVNADVSTQAIKHPNGLYSLDATHLLVLGYDDAEVWNLTLSDGVETGRARVATVAKNAAGRRGLDGITRDAQGRWYLGDNGAARVVRRPADWSAPASGLEEELAAGVRSAANLAFGRGALACTDLYVASGDKMVVIATE